MIVDTVVAVFAAIMLANRAEGIYHKARRIMERRDGGRHERH